MKSSSSHFACVNLNLPFHSAALRSSAARRRLANDCSLFLFQLREGSLVRVSSFFSRSFSRTALQYIYIFDYSVQIEWVVLNTNETIFFHRKKNVHNVQASLFHQVPRMLKRSHNDNLYKYMNVLCHTVGGSSFAYRFWYIIVNLFQNNFVICIHWRLTWVFESSEWERSSHSPL